MKDKDQMPHISLCIVTKDNASHIPLTLSSVKNIVDEIVVVDLGSTDGTQRIAREFDAKVIDNLKDEKVTEARKIALENAQGDWILQLDPGHEIVMGKNPDFRSKLKSNSHDGFFIREYSLENLQDYYYQPVLYKNLPDLTFNQIFDESPILCSQSSEDLPGSNFNIGLMQDIRIYHRANDLKIQKLRENINGIHEALRNDSQNISLYFYLAFFQRELGNKDEFQIAVQKGIQIMTQNKVDLMIETKESTGLFGFFAESLVQQNVTEIRTINSLIKLQRTLPADIRLNTPLAVLLQKIGRTKEALELLQEAIRLSYIPRWNTLSYYDSFVLPVYQFLEIIRQSQNENEFLRVILNIQNLSGSHGFGMRSFFIFLKEHHPEFLNMIDGVLKRKLSAGTLGKESKV